MESKGNFLESIFLGVMSYEKGSQPSGLLFGKARAFYHWIGQVFLFLCVYACSWC